MKNGLGVKFRDTAIVIGVAVVILGFIYLAVLGAYALR